MRSYFNWLFLERYSQSTVMLEIQINTNRNENYFYIKAIRSWRTGLSEELNVKGSVPMSYTTWTVTMSAHINYVQSFVAH